MLKTEDVATESEVGEEAPPALTGKDLTKLRKSIKAACKDIKKLKDQRSELSSQISAIKSDLAAQGIDKRTFQRAYEDWETQQTEEGERKLKQQATAASICREAIGLPQLDLFEENGKEKPTTH